MTGENAGESKGMSKREVLLGPRRAADSGMNDFDQGDWEKSMSLLLIITPFVFRVWSPVILHFLRLGTVVCLLQSFSHNFFFL